MTGNKFEGGFDSRCRNLTPVGTGTNTNTRLECMNLTLHWLVTKYIVPLCICVKMIIWHLCFAICLLESTENENLIDTVEEM